MLQPLQLDQDVLVDGQRLAHAHEEVDDADADGDGLLALEHIGQHEEAVLGEGEGRVLGMLALL